MSGVQVQNPFMASLWIGSGAGWPLKGLGLASPYYQVGAHFEALDEGVLMAVLKSFEHFFAISNSAVALWVWLSTTPAEQEPTELQGCLLFFCPLSIPLISNWFRVPVP